MSSGRGGGVFNALIANPLKTLFSAFLIFALLVILVLPTSEAFPTIKYGTNLAWTTIGAVAGTIPPGIQAFKSSFTEMGKTSASAPKCDPAKKVC